MGKVPGCGNPRCEIKSHLIQNLSEIHDSHSDDGNDGSTIEVSQTRNLQTELDASLNILIQDSKEEE